MNKSNKILLIVLLLLGGLYLLNKYVLSDNGRNFREVFIALDSARVTKFEIMTPEAKNVPYVIEKEGANWMFRWDGKQDDADSKAVKSMLGTLARMDVERLLGSRESQWVENEVSDSLATHVKVFAGDEVLADFYVGKFNFQAASRSAITSVRMADEIETYGVEGFMGSIFKRTPDNIRDKTFVRAELTDFNKVTIEVNGDQYLLAKTINGGWAVDGAAADSAAVTGYLNGIKNQRFYKFAEDFDPGQANSVGSLLLQLGAEEVPVRIFRSNDKFIVNSGQNSDAYFSTDSTIVYNKLLKDKKALLPGEE